MELGAAFAAVETKVAKTKVRASDTPENRSVDSFRTLCNSPQN
ncbi:MAG: hypothetical protein RI899_108 [Actinomycetota bacterium]|jgi:hypothetical protein